MDKVEDANDNGMRDPEEADGDANPPPDNGDKKTDGDYLVLVFKDGQWKEDWKQQLSPFDIDNNGKVEWPPAKNVPVNPANEYSRDEIVRRTVTHEMGHAAGIPENCKNDTGCTMSVYSDLLAKRFCKVCSGMLLVHNQ